MKTIFFFQGAFIWLQDESGHTVGGKVKSATGDNVTAEAFDGSVITAHQSKFRLMHPSSIAGVNDMITLGDLHEGALFYNLACRFYRDSIYTYTGNILVAVNPFKNLNIYDMDCVKRYKAASFGDLPPHIFAIANETYLSLNKMHQNQCVVISGESGAGKTESTKLILHFLAQASLKKSLVQDQIIEASPILEAFGNAKTVRNDNSSRFGKFIEVQFDKDGSIKGALILQYLLEKSRVVTQAKEERNYHIFYSLLAGSSAEEKQRYVLLAPEKYNYLNKSGCVKVDSITDSQDFSTVKDAMTTLKFDKEQSEIFTVLSAILHIGNITFSADGDNAKIANPDVVKVVSKLLRIDENEFALALVNKKTVTRGETFVSPLNVSQATDSRDATAKALYGRLFSWIVSYINDKTRQKGELPFVGVLDIFGFEDFEVNSFEQFCINYANERLQLYFNHHIFKLEQEEYEKEQVSWSKIEFIDNQGCIDLIGKKPLGLVQILDEESNFPKSTDQSFLAKIYQNYEKNAYFVKPKQQKAVFGIRHYAGDVTYTADNFLEKNRDTLRADLQDVLSNSALQLVVTIFSQSAEEVPSLDFAGASEDATRSGNSTMRSLASSSSGLNGSVRSATSKKTPTVGAQFHASLNDLISTLTACNPYFVRCVKPNSQKVAGKMDLHMVTAQLRYSGMLETIKVRKAGYAVRTLFSDFLQRYHIILPSVRNSPTGENCKKLLSTVKSLNSGDYVIGVSKVFLKSHVENELEKDRAQKLMKYVTRLQAFGKMVAARRKYREIRQAVIVCQNFIHAFLIRRRYLRMVYLTKKVQARWRGQRVRKVWGPKIKNLAIARIQKQQQELEKKKIAQAKVQELIQNHKNTPDVAAQLEKDAAFLGLSEEDQERQRDLLAGKPPVAVRNSLRTGRQSSETPGPPINLDLAEEIMQILSNEIPVVYALPQPPSVPYVPLDQVRTFIKEQKQLEGTTALGSLQSEPSGNNEEGATPLSTSYEDSSLSRDSLLTLKGPSNESEASSTLAKLEKLFCRDGQNLQASRIPLKQSLIQLPSDISSVACDVYKALLKYVYELVSTEHSLLIFNYIIDKLSKANSASLIDEFFCQICKQTNYNSSEFAALRAWKLFNHFSGVFAPTEGFFQKVYQYVGLGAPEFCNTSIQRRLRRTKANGNRYIGYSCTEYLALENQKQLVLTAQFVDGNSIHFEADSATTGGEMIAAMSQCVQLQSPEGYVIFIDMGGQETRVISYEHLFDTIARLEKQKATLKSPGSSSFGLPAPQGGAGLNMNNQANHMGVSPSTPGAPPPPPASSKPPLPGSKPNVPAPPTSTKPNLTSDGTTPLTASDGGALPKIPWKLYIKRGYIYPCQNIDAYDFEITFQQIAMDMRKKQACPPDQLSIVQRLIGELAKLEVIQAALEWSMYLCQFFPVREKSFSFLRTEIAVDQRGLHVVDASQGRKEVTLSVRYDDLIIKDSTDHELHLVMDDKDYHFQCRGKDIQKALLGYTVPLKFLSNASIAIADFPGNSSDHLPLKKGQLVQVLDRDPENGWMQGQSGEKIGWFPMDFVHVLLDPVVYDAQNLPVMRPAALAASVDLEKKLRENKVDMVKFSVMSSDKYGMVEYAKLMFDERHFTEAKHDGGFAGTLRRTFGASISGTLRKKQNVDELMKSLVTDDMVTKALSWQATPPKYPLTRLAESADNKLMIENFSNVMALMGDIATKSHRADLAIHMVNLGMGKESLRDEIYVQVLKQVTNNRSPKNDSVKKGWDLLMILCTFLVPTQTFEPYLRCFIHQAASSANKDIAAAAHECDVRLTRSKMQPRNLPPMEMEIEAIVNKKLMPLKVTFPEDTVKSFLFHSHTTAKEILKKIFDKYDLPESNEYGLYVVLSNGYVALPVLPNDKVTDIIYLSKMIVESELTAAPGALPLTPSGEYFTIEFVRKLWLEQPLNLSQALQNLIYHQVLKDFLRSSLFSSNEIQPQSLAMIAELIAIAYRVFKGPDQVIEVSRNAEESILRPWIPDIVFSKQSQAEWDSQIAKFYAKSKALADVDARAKFLEVLKNWDLFGSSFFAIRASNDPRFAQGGLLCVDGVGIRVLDWATRNLVISYGYDEIVNFRYDDNEFVMRTGDLMQKRIVRCQTNQGFVIADLIHSYVQYHMNQQVAKSPSQNEVNRITS